MTPWPEEWMDGDDYDAYLQAIGYYDDPAAPSTAPAAQTAQSTKKDPPAAPAASCGPRFTWGERIDCHRPKGHEGAHVASWIAGEPHAWEDDNEDDEGTAA